MSVSFNLQHYYLNADSRQTTSTEIFFSDYAGWEIKINREILPVVALVVAVAAPPKEKPMYNDKIQKQQK